VFGFAFEYQEWVFDVRLSLGMVAMVKAGNRYADLKVFWHWCNGVYWIEVIGRFLGRCSEMDLWRIEEGIVLDCDRPMFHV